MPTPLHLNNNRDFIYAYRRGKSFVSPILVTYVVKNRLGQNQIGITTSKKIGNAVMRNRSRRVIRAAFRSLPYKLKEGYNIVFVARTRTSQVKMQKILSVMTSHLSAYKAEEEA